MQANTFKYNNLYILRISFISALGGYLFGFDFAVISGALSYPEMKAVIDASINKVLGQ